MIGSNKYKLSDAAHKMYDAAVKQIEQTKYTHITNPCGEITLHSKGGYCVLSSIVPFFCDTLKEVKETAAIAARFLIRVNTMDSIYKDEVIRTNRIGVGMTGIHEFALKFFNYGFYDLIDESVSQDFWDFIGELRVHTEQAAYAYSSEIGVAKPHTVTTMKPDGSIAKLFGLTEGAHLAAHKFYLRWVQFQNTDPLIQQYKKEGYPTILSKKYPDVTMVGFPTVPMIATLDPEKVVTASEASPSDQFKYLMLLEKYWLGEGNNQISYTLKFDTEKHNIDDFRAVLASFQSKVRCCAVMPTMSDAKIKELYEYLPEEEVSKEYFDFIMNNLNKETDIAFTKDELQCASGACPM
jgi:hypothetical protein